MLTFRQGRSYPKVSSSRKASSTPSLPEATIDGAKPLVESFEQTVSADNLSSKQVRDLTELGKIDNSKKMVFKSSELGENDKPSASSNLAMSDVESVVVSAFNEALSNFTANTKVI